MTCTETALHCGIIWITDGRFTSDSELKWYPSPSYFLFLTWLSIIRNQEFRLYIYIKLLQFLSMDMFTSYGHIDKLK